MLYFIINLCMTGAVIYFSKYNLTLVIVHIYSTFKIIKKIEFHTNMFSVIIFFLLIP